MGAVMVHAGCSVRWLGRSMGDGDGDGDRFEVSRDEGQTKDSTSVCPRSSDKFQLLFLRSLRPNSALPRSVRILATHYLSSIPK